ncbi:hypothetical protein [Laspinema olomoucense]|uniref:Uncharacterized protein n=1 Tax=Laspinema olomoucense D3b TaxID=2953688 RepID=A0ABT2N1Z8_9CYAN|nr:MULTISPECIES: hypothetical protein [unclassified Laspinema]MCT7976714.1 hypothetical protein [Laspinema sp. D3b]MCT7995588.1 hypothetical protein [Laspinema sp. D3c]
MGRKAKLKKLRHTAPLPAAAPPVELEEPTNFVREMDHQGYHLKQTIPAPDIPESQMEPKAQNPRL